MYFSFTYCSFLSWYFSIAIFQCNSYSLYNLFCYLSQLDGQLILIKFTSFDEFYCIDTDRSKRQKYIVAFSKTRRTALVLDPLIPFKSNDLDQVKGVEREKKNIYEKCFPFLTENFHKTFKERKFNMRDLWSGSHRTIPKSTSIVSFIEGLGVNVGELTMLAEKIIFDSLGYLLVNHLLTYHLSQNNIL